MTESTSRYPATHGYSPGRHGGGEGCRVLRGGYYCPWTVEQHDPDLPPEPRHRAENLPKEKNR